MTRRRLPATLFVLLVSLAVTFGTVALTTDVAAAGEMYDPSGYVYDVVVNDADQLEIEAALVGRPRFRRSNGVEIFAGPAQPSLRPSPNFVAPSGAVDDVVGTANRFSIHDRVAGQLNDPRLGNLQGRFGTDDLQALTTSPNATADLDVRSGHINVIQEIDGVLLRVTTAADEFRIISVGRVRPAQLTNGSMIPIGSGG